MTLKLDCEYLRFSPGTLENVRKEYGFEKPGTMDQAIDMLQDWVHKQEHFVKKDLPREYLERFIISSKGSVEKAKARIDRLCTMRTVAPNLFEKCHAQRDFPKLSQFFINLIMPDLSEDNYRIHIGKLMSKTITPSACLEAYQHCGIILEYGKLHDYAKGYYVVYDLSEADVLNLITNIDLVDLRNILSLTIEAYGFKISAIYIISSSTMINALIKILKQMVSAKMAERFHVLKNAESLSEYLPKHLLPKEFGGENKSIFKLYDEMNTALSSKEHIAHMEEMGKVCTNEKLRHSDRFDQEYLGMPGSFRMLNVD